MSNLNYQDVLTQVHASPLVVIDIAVLFACCWVQLAKWLFGSVY
jgi:hypothetical protein